MTTANTPVLTRAAAWPAWYTVVLLCGAAVLISYIDRTNISVAAIPMQAQFGWTETTKGWVLSSFFVGYLAFMAVSGALANRFGGKYILGAGAALIAAIAWGIKQRMAGKAAERARQAAADAKAVNAAKQVQTNVDAMKPDDARKELDKWSKP